MKRNNRQGGGIGRKNRRALTLVLVIYVCLSLAACDAKPALQPGISDTSSAGSLDVDISASGTSSAADTQVTLMRELWVDYLFDLCYIIQGDFPSNYVQDSDAIVEYALLKAYRDNVLDNQLPPLKDNDGCRLNLITLKKYIKRYFNIEDISVLNLEYCLSDDGSYVSSYVGGIYTKPDDTLTNEVFLFKWLEQPDNETVKAYIDITGNEEQACVTLKKNGEGGYYIQSVITKSTSDAKPLIQGSYTKFDYILGLDADRGLNLGTCGSIDGKPVLFYIRRLSEQFLLFDLNAQKEINTLLVDYEKEEWPSFTKCNNDMLYVATNKRLMVFDHTLAKVYEYKLPANDYQYSFYFNKDNLHMRMADREAVLDKNLQVIQAKMLPSEAVGTYYEFNDDFSLLCYVNETGLYLYDYATATSKFIAPHPLLPKGNQNLSDVQRFSQPSFINEGKTIHCTIGAFEGVAGHLLYDIQSGRHQIFDMYYWEGGGIDIDADYLYYYTDYHQDTDKNIKINLDDFSTEVIPPLAANRLQEMYSSGSTAYYFSCDNEGCYHSCFVDEHVKYLYKKNSGTDNDKTSFSIQGGRISLICDDGAGHILAAYSGKGSKGYLIIDVNQ